MIVSFVKPKHTFLSVAEYIEEGLNNDTVFLNEKELINAGHEIPSHVVHPLIKFLDMIFTTVYSIAVVFFIYTVWFKPSSTNSQDDPISSFLANAAAIFMSLVLIFFIIRILSRHLFRRAKLKKI